MIFLLKIQIDLSPADYRRFADLGAEHGLSAEAFIRLLVRQAAHPPVRTLTVEAVARACGVSSMTASLALRRSPNVDPERAKAIRAKAKAMGWKPNVLASCLARGQGRRKKGTGPRSRRAWEKRLAA